MDELSAIILVALAFGSALADILVAMLLSWISLTLYKTVPGPPTS
jgi:hypothetical protein